MEKRNKILLIIGIISFVLFVITGVLVRFNMDNSFDQSVTHWFVNERSVSLTVLFKIITNLCHAITIGVLCFGALIYLRASFTSWMIQINALGAYAFNFVVKYIFGRARPAVVHLVEERSLSFPSGHATVSLCLYGFLVYLLLTRKQLQKSTQWILGSMTGVVIVFVGISRIYLGVHYTTDIIGGFLLGAVWLSLFIFVYETLIKKKALKKEVAQSSTSN